MTSQNVIFIQKPRIRAAVLMDKQRFYQACCVLAYALTRQCDGIISVLPTVMCDDLKAVFELRHRLGDAFVTISVCPRNRRILTYKIQRIDDEGCLLGACSVDWNSGDWYAEICFCVRRVVLSRHPFFLIRLQRWFRPILWAKAFLSVVRCL